MNNENEYHLKPEEKALLDAISAEMADLQIQANAVIKSIARANKLLGNWEWDGQKFNKRN